MRERERSAATRTRRYATAVPWVSEAGTRHCREAHEGAAMNYEIITVVFENDEFPPVKV
jgi:hypothetical protein